MSTVNAQKRRSFACQHATSNDTPPLVETFGVDSRCIVTNEEVIALSVPREECGIQTLPFETISAIWDKQELNSERDIVPAPGSDSKAMMVCIKIINVPHFVCSTLDGQSYCDNGCLQWKSSKICAHTVAIVGKNNDLCTFLQWYICTNQEPNISTLAMSGLPSGRGRKGGVPKRKRRIANQNKLQQVMVHHPATIPGVPTVLVKFSPKSSLYTL